MKEPAKTWNEFFKSIQNEDFCLKLNDFLNREYNDYVCYPKRENIFNAFKMTKLSDVKVVIIGQDPYHEPGQAMGLSFSVPTGIVVPQSLKNIYKEIENEFNDKCDMKNGDLSYLAKQGVFLLNSILSVREHQPLSHNIDEYKLFIKAVLETIDHQCQPIVYMLWGGPAKKYAKYLHNPSHLVLQANHPSPLSANRGGWFGNNHFKLANEYLKNNKTKPINWIRK